MISKVLVANRGEIARRVFRTCRDMGIATVAVFSVPDADEPHAIEADESVALLGSTAAETYLDMDAVLAAAKETGADAIHPGYGFLAENASFARQVVGQGLTWIGPSPEAIEIMGSKLASKRLMTQAGLMTLPSVEIADDTDVIREAARIGYPLLVKASAGGGGKGMRIVEDENALADSVVSAQREAGAAFGDDTVFLEKYLPAPRHIEIQVFGDSQGNVISLYERECSIQRRHQKIIEEAPSPVIDDKTRETMGRAAVDAAHAVDYVGAGTVEFLYQDGEFFFLEMNTRLQVEHPVTEMITGLDLVKLQIDVANGGSVPKAPPIEGHAIEARLYAEDPTNDFLPVTGQFHKFELPDMVGLRVDAGIGAGSTVSVFYDPMIAKVIAHGPNRDKAASALSGALRQARIHGSVTNRELLIGVLEHPEFVSGNIDTSFLDRNEVAVLARPLLDYPTEHMAAGAAAFADQATTKNGASPLSSIQSGWRNMGHGQQRRSYQGPGGIHDVFYDVESSTFEVEGQLVQVAQWTDDRSIISVSDSLMTFLVSRYGNERYVDTEIGSVQLTALPRFPTRETEDDVGSLHAPMPGKVIQVGAEVGDSVVESDILVVMEAMKMEHTLRAPHTGTVSQVLCAPGDQVEAHAVLVVVDES